MIVVDLQRQWLLRPDQPVPKLIARLRRRAGDSADLTGLTARARTVARPDRRGEPLALRLRRKIGLATKLRSLRFRRTLVLDCPFAPGIHSRQLGHFRAERAICVPQYGHTFTSQRGRVIDMRVDIWRISEAIICSGSPPPGEDER